MLEGFGLPIPMELLYFGGIGPLVRGQHISYATGVAIACGGTLIGNIIGYYIGQVGGTALVNYLSRALNISDEALGRFEGWFRKHGLKAILVVRWTGLGYAQLTWFCGLAGVPLWKFVLVAGISDLLWAMVWTYAGDRAAGVLHLLLRPDVLVPLFLAAILGLGGFWLYRRRRARADRPNNETGDKI